VKKFLKPGKKILKPFQILVKVIKFLFVLFYLQCANLPMKKEMGTYYSSLSCERISKSLHNCFGLKTGRTYETEANSKKNLSTSPLQNDNSSLGSEENIAIAQLKRKSSRKNRRCSRETCCCRGGDADNDGFAYNICSQSTEDSHVSLKPKTELVYFFYTWNEFFYQVP